MTVNTDILIDLYIRSIARGIDILSEEKLFGQVLILLYSHIDALGLLDAPPSQTTANGDSFKKWVIKFLLPDPRINFNEIDLWAARCALVHTYTSESNLSNSGTAKQLQYFTGPPDSPQAKKFIEATEDIDGGKHLPVHVEGLLLVFLAALSNQAQELSTNCENDPAYAARLHKILQQYDLQNMDSV